VSFIASSLGIFLQSDDRMVKKSRRQFAPHFISQDSANKNTLADLIKHTDHRSQDFKRKARLNLINRAGPSPREDGSRWCQAQENKVAPARSVRIRFKKRTFAHAGEQSLRSNTCSLILRLIFELGNLYYFPATGKPLRYF